MTVNGIATTHSSAGRCEYEVKLPGDPTYYVYLGDFYAPFNTVIPGQFYNLGYTCYFNSIGGTFYVAFAEVENTFGYCNTDNIGPSSNVFIVNTGLQEGVTVYTSQFNQWAQSTVSGSPFFWEYEVCQENLPGQHVNYVCVYANLGPLE